MFPIPIASGDQQGDKSYLDVNANAITAAPASVVFFKCLLIISRKMCYQTSKILYFSQNFIFIKIPTQTYMCIHLFDTQTRTIQGKFNENEYEGCKVNVACAVIVFRMQLFFSL